MHCGVIRYRCSFERLAKRYVCRNNKVVKTFVKLRLAALEHRNCLVEPELWHTVLFSQIS
jgi:hypothetical protein